jgi:hypothetical protein
MTSIMEKIRNCLYNGEPDRVAELVMTALGQGTDAREVLQ